MGIAVSDNAVQNAAAKHGSTLFAEIYSPILVKVHCGRLCTQDAMTVGSMGELYQCKDRLSRVY